MSERRIISGAYLAALAAMALGPVVEIRDMPRVDHGPLRSSSHSKRGMGRKHRSGRAKEWPFGPGETAVSVSPERRLLYMHSAARKRATLPSA